MKTEQIITIFKVISWIIFIGLCINAGGIVISAIIDFIKDGDASALYSGLDLSELKQHSSRYYLYILSFLVPIAALKAYIWFLVVQLFSKINLEQPFTLSLSATISSISYYTLIVGILSIIAKSYDKWLSKKGIDLPLDWGASDYLFMAGIVFIIGLIIKRGVEIQTENELTI
jgi:hypothetical protein